MPLDRGAFVIGHDLSCKPSPAEPPEQVSQPDAGVQATGSIRWCEHICRKRRLAETFFKTLKSELVWRTIFYTRQEADQAIGRYIDGFYNPVRRHSALDFTSPAQVRKNGRRMSQCLSTKTGEVQGGSSHSETEQPVTLLHHLQ